MHIPDIGNASLTQRLQHKLDQKTKPRGSLGRLESLALQLGLVLGTETPRLEQPQLVVFAADHVADDRNAGRDDDLLFPVAVRQRESLTVA